MNRTPSTVLLTGATGFLGAWVCRELVEQTDARVVCLVRGGSPQEAGRRLRARLTEVGLDEPGRRVRAVPGDLDRPLLGMMPAHYARLADEAQAIYHCGASINLASSYRTLRNVNIRAVHELLGLAATGSFKPLHHVSTAAVLSEESWSPYVRSKIVAERMVSIGREYGVATTIYRPVLILGHSETGAAQTADTMFQLMAACVYLGATPRTDRGAPAACVDDVAQTLVARSLKDDGSQRVHHLYSSQPMRWDSAFAALRQIGYELDELPLNEWMRALNRHRGVKPIRALLAMNEAFLALVDNRQDSLLTRLYATEPAIDRPATAATLARSARYFADAGFLPKPGYLRAA